MERHPHHVEPCHLEPPIVEATGDTIDHEASAPATPRPPALKLMPLVIIMFYLVSGGPFGTEEAIKAGGAFYTLVGFLVVPFVWSLPECQISAELSVAFPDASGGVVWCEAAFGPFAGWLNGILSCISGMTDNAIYPVLFLDYLLKILPEEAQQEEALHPVKRFLLLSFISMCLGYMNYRGLNFVGRMAIVICIIAMSPFVIMAILSINKIEPSRWMIRPNLTATEYTAISDYDLGGGFFPNASFNGILLRPFLNVLFWNLNSFDAVGSFSEEVGEHPERIIPQAMTITWVILVFAYLIPLLVATGVSDSTQADWEDGYLAQVAKDAFGPWLEGWVVFAAFISNLALFQAELSSDSFSLYGMANKGMMPEFLRVRSRHGTPTNSIIVGVGVIIIFSVAHLDKLIEMLNWVYAIDLLMEYAAFIKLRLYHPDLPRPYKVPLSTPWCIVAIIPPVAATLLVMALASFATMLLGIFSVLFATALYFVFKKNIRAGATTYSRVHQLSNGDAEYSSDVEIT